MSRPVSPRAPAWLTRLLEAGFTPYVATARHLLPALELTPFGVPVTPYLLDDTAHAPFHEAYLLSNSLSFASPELKMPHWVLIDCALMQTAVVGFTRPTGELPADFVAPYAADPRIELARVPHIPVSGQIASPALLHRSFVGISLFSLGRHIGAPSGLGLYTKALALEVYKARPGATFLGIAQYDNPALKIHGRFAPRMFIEQAMVPLHPKRDMTLIYTHTVEYDPERIDEIPEPREPTFWLDATDRAAKLRIEAGIQAGRRYEIAPPYACADGNRLRLPIIEE